jgi:uncharacterized damage-inducible protein DinB
MIEQKTEAAQSKPMEKKGRRTEIDLLIEQLRDAFEGDPWFGRNAKLLLGEVDEATAVVKLNGQHSILELVWHMCTWREFTISFLKPPSDQNLHHFEELDWRELDHNNYSLWTEGLERLERTQQELLSVLRQQDDAILDENVRERTYNYRKLITGIIQHDIYHLGQITFIWKQMKNRDKGVTTNFF